MKIVTKMSLAMLPAMALVLGGCGGTAEQEEAPAPTPTAETRSIVPPPAEPEPADTGMAEAEQAPEPVDPLEDPNSLLSQRIIYFDFDSSVVHDDAMPVIQAHAEYLANNSGTSFTLEGHCDERGTREYNIALGERRADAVRRLLIANGVSESQIKVVSYGEERPAQLGHNETAWSANRRAVFAY